MYNINFYYLIQELVFPLVRKATLVDFIYMASKPLRTIYNRFIAQKQATDYKLLFNGQVIYLEHVLNDLFDPIGRTIFISDDANVDYDYIYRLGENPSEKQIIYTAGETPTEQVYLNTQTEELSQNNFVVNIPSSVTDLFRLRSVVDTYKLAGKTYIINVI